MFVQKTFVFCDLDASSGHSVAQRDDVRLNSLTSFYNSESVSEVRFRFGVMARRVGVHGLQVMSVSITYVSAVSAS